MRFKIQTFSILTLTSLILLACNDTLDTDESSFRAQQSVYFPNQIGQKSVMLQMAMLASEKARGLMFRDTLALDHGLCFISDRPKQQSFWMRNTRIPLDLAHFDSEGILLEIQQLYPFDETPVKSLHHRIQYSIEMNQGWFQRNNIRLGTKLNLRLLQEVIHARSGRLHL